MNPGPIAQCLPEKGFDLKHWWVWTASSSKMVMQCYAGKRCGLHSNLKVGKGGFIGSDIRGIQLHVHVWVHWLTYLCSELQDILEVLRHICQFNLQKNKMKNDNHSPACLAMRMNLRAARKHETQCKYRRGIEGRRDKIVTCHDAFPLPFIHVYVHVYILFTGLQNILQYTTRTQLCTTQ